MKWQKSSEELRRTSEKIKYHIVNPSSDGTDRMMSAVATQSKIAFEIETIEAQPSNAGKKKEGYRAPLRRAVEMICGKLDRPDLESVLQILEDQDRIDDWYGLTPAAIDIHVVEVFRDSKKLRFSERSGREKTVSFKRIQNLIDMYKAELPE